MLVMKGPEVNLRTDNPEASIEIPTVSELLYMKTREALAKEGYIFVVNIESVSIGQLLSHQATSLHFEYVNPSENMRTIVPPQMEVVVNPKSRRIENSNSKSTDVQIRMIEEEEAVLRVRLPKEVRNLISMRVQNVSVLVQTHFKYKEATGKVFFANDKFGGLLGGGWFAGTDDQTSPGRVAFVGRYSAPRGLYIGDTNRARNNEDNNVFAPRLVVLPRKLVA